MRTAPHPAPAGVRGPLRELLDPVRALRHAAAAVPEFRSGAWTPLDLSPQRLEVRKDGRTDLVANVRFRDSAGREQIRPLLIRPRNGGEPRFRLSPDDPSMPGLEERLREVTATLGPGTLRVLAHRFGRRVTLRWTAGDPGAPGGPRDLILKVYARGEDERAAGMLRTLSAARLPFRTPSLAAHRPADGLVMQSVLPGASAHDVLRSGSAIPAAVLGRAVTAVRGLRAEGLREHRLEDELAVVRKFADRTEAVDARLADDLRAAVETFRRHAGADGAGAASGGAEPLVFAHRDLHDKQILCDGPAIGLIDWDLAAFAPASLDPGNFLAHLTLRSFQGRILAERAETTREAFLAGLGGTPGWGGTPAPGGPEGPDGPGVRDLHNWVSVTLLRLVGVYALRPGWPGLSRRLLAAFHHSLETA